MASRLTREMRLSIAESMSAASMLTEPVNSHSSLVGTMTAAVKTKAQIANFSSRALSLRPVPEAETCTISCLLSGS